MAAGKGITEFIRFGHVKIPSTVSFYRSNLSYAFVNKSPILPGHVLVSPLRPVERFSGLTPDEVSDLFLTVQKVSNIIEKMYNATALTISMQDGEDAGQSIKHVHVHILPRKKGDFQHNDDIYKEIETHDKDKERKDRSLEEMENETILIREFITLNK
ncbi:Fragile histidine triad L homeolog [Oopsacas minuta]|uniref:Bis(5'-adenosyl)-triphosphatase n=1 Tax=Oopsacas minuta TaxID=111878 RepID=A0AAV7KBD3_9METZ|nr:Fragile histidine triad L homeolog [Oopsacas minuta]